MRPLKHLFFVLRGACSYCVVLLVFWSIFRMYLPTAIVFFFVFLSLVCRGMDDDRHEAAPC